MPYGHPWTCWKKILQPGCPGMGHIKRQGCHQKHHVRSWKNKVTWAVLSPKISSLHRSLEINLSKYWFLLVFWLPLSDFLYPLLEFPPHPFIIFERCHHDHPSDVKNIDPATSNSMILHDFRFYKIFYLKEPLSLRCVCAPCLHSYWCQESDRL